jgi:translation initiation factor IF-2
VGGVSISTGIGQDRQGIDNLLEKVLQVAEMKEIKANPDRPATGIVVEGHWTKDARMATVLVLNGNP